MDEPITATDFKEHCLAVLDRVARTGLGVTVTRRGVPIARIEPATPPAPRSLLGTVRYGDEADLVGPADEPWDADS